MSKHNKYQQSVPEIPIKPTDNRELEFKAQLATIIYAARIAAQQQHNMVLNNAVMQHAIQEAEQIIDLVRKKNET